MFFAFSGKKQAAQAVARIGITINPEVAFPGQRCMEVIRPLLAILHQECTALENFEALMALCNLAGVSDSVRKRILSEGGFSKIEAYMYEDHEMLQRASVQCINNLLLCDETIQFFEKENDRVKFLVILSEDEDEPLCLAASGALAILTSASKIACAKIVDCPRWVDTMKFLLANPSSSIQHRGLVIIINIIQSKKELAALVINTDIMEVLMALSKIDADNPKIRELAMQALQAASDWKLIEKNAQAEDPAAKSGDVFEKVD